MRKSLSLVLALTLVLTAAACTKKTAHPNTQSTTTSAAAPGSTTTAAPPVTVVLNPGTGSTAAYIQAIAVGLTNSDASSGLLVLTPAQAKCTAPRWADAIGVKLLEKGGKPQDYTSHTFSFPSLGLSAAQATTMVDSFGACQVDVYSEYITTLTTSLNASAATRACIQRNLDRATVRQSLIASLADKSGSTANAAVTKLSKACRPAG